MKKKKSFARYSNNFIVYKLLSWACLGTAYSGLGYKGV